MPKFQSLNNRFISHSHLSLVDKGLCSTLTFREVSRWSFPQDAGEGSVRPIRLWFLKVSILKWYVTTTQTLLANVTSMVMANLGLVGTQRAGECDPTAERSWWVTRATTLHSCPCAVFFGSAHPAPSSLLAGNRIQTRLKERTYARPYKCGENKKGKKKRKNKNSKSVRIIF